jgi:hypothetical protein
MNKESNSLTCAALEFKFDFKLKNNGEERTQVCLEKCKKQKKLKSMVLVRFYMLKMQGCHC